MKPIIWDDEKNNALKEERGLSFEAIVIAIERGNLLATRQHPKRVHQKIFEVELDGYVIVVPYIENKDSIFLKTAFHSRKANKLHKKGII
jgi:uncharacterized DUF497 family protein